MTKATIISVAKALVVNEKNQALILTVGEYKSHPEKSFKPDLPGGLVDPGESEHEAVIREIKEEAGIEIDSSRIQLAYTETEYVEKGHKSITKLFYLAFLDHTPDVRISWEHASYEWVPLAGLTQSTEFRPFYKNAINYCADHELIP
ncbi:MAG: hydrolase [Candidatus Saccharibacteria bacterium]|nr:hydrolase [Candidatus Saccharibacteria bacterium]